MSRPLRTLLLTLLMTLAGATAAHAAPSQDLIFDAQRDLINDGTRAAALDELESLGVDHVRLILYWKDVAPQPDSRRDPKIDALLDPASYDWSRYEPVMAALRERDMDVTVVLTTPGPRWAMRGEKDHVRRPSRRQFGAFVEVAGRKYGEQVGQWSVLNEPNHPDFLMPQYAKGKKPRSPKIYRKLFITADRALRRSGNGADTLLMGETAPRGTGKVVAPLTFLRGSLCLNRRYKRKKRSCNRIGADGWAHHAYTTKAGPFFVPPSRNDVTIGVLGRLNRALNKASRARMIRRNVPIYLTEFGIQSTPDRFIGVSLKRQNEYRAISERLAYGNRRVKAFSQYLLSDDLPRDGVAASARYGGFESGLRFATGRDKPSLQGFKLTLTALRASRNRVSIWGLVRSAQGRTQVEIQYRNRGSRTWRRLKSDNTNSRGYFTTRTSYRKGRQYRIAWDGEESPAVRVFRRP